MRSAHHVVITVAVAALLLIPSLAGAVDLIYSGETPETGYGADELWDYVYNLSSVGPVGPDVWGIQVDYAPLQGTIANPGNWSGQWFSSISHPSLSQLSGRPGIVWELESFGSFTGPFSFQSTNEPGRRPWQASGSSNFGSGSEWSASPEPASMALTSLALLGVGFWRRRRAAS